MGRRKDKKDRKPFKETAFGKIVTKLAPELLGEVVDNIPGAKFLMKAKDVIFGKKSTGTISETDFVEFSRLHELELQELDMRLKDTADARAMQAEALKSGDKVAGRYVYVLATFIILAAIGFGVAMIFVDIPEANKRLVEMFADIFLFAGAMSVINYFFGSSAGSKRKTDLIGK